MYDKCGKLKVKPTNYWNFRKVLYAKMSKKDEALTITFSHGNFSSHEIKEIKESYAKIMPVKHLYFVRMTAEILPAVLIFSIGFVLGTIAEGFFKAMGSDLYRIAKEKVIRILQNKKSPSLIFRMSYKGTKISVTCQTKHERELNKVFDTIGKARDIAIKEIDKKEVPEMNEMTIKYDNGWILDSGKYWKPPKDVKFYTYNKKTGKWELVREWAQKP